MSRWDKASKETFYFLGDTQILAHILEGAKASAKHDLKCLPIEVFLMFFRNYDGLTVSQQNILVLLPALIR
jgi:hypothetical protein